MCPSPIQKDSQLDSSDREQPNRPNSVLRTGMSLKVTKAKTSYTTLFPPPGWESWIRSKWEIKNKTYRMLNICDI